MKEIWRLKNLKVLLVIVPLIYYGLNLQYFLVSYLSETIGQLGAYSMFACGVVALFLMVLTENDRRKPTLAKLWYAFFVVYYVIGFWANVMTGYEAPYLKTLIPVFFFFALIEFFKSEKRAKLTLKISMAVLTLANILLIFFQKINYSLDHDGVYKYELERAGGVYGDANNAALVCLISFVLFRNLWNPRQTYAKIVRLFCIGIALYGLVLAFSKTGMVIFLLILIIQQLERIDLKRLFKLFVLLPLVLIMLVQFGLTTDILTEAQKDRLENVINIITFNVDKVDSSHRDDLLLNMFDYIFENPIIGNGIYLSSEIRGHNTIIGVWADAGIFAFLLFLTIIAVYTHKALTSSPKVKVFSLSILSILVIYMLTLQTVINQVYLLPFFVYLCYILEAKKYYGPKFELRL